MPFSEAYYQTYQHLPEKLAKQYSELPFDNHCYLRIALDNTFQTKWDTVLKRPAYMHLTKENKDTVIELLKVYASNIELVKKHNKKSLHWRKKSR